MVKMHRELVYARPMIKAVEATTDEWDLIKSFMVRPDGFKAEDVRTYKFHLAHNFVDRDEERFTAGTLNQFAKTIVGKEFLIAHSWGPPGEGKFYGAEVVQVDIDTALMIAADHPDPEVLRKLLERIQGIDGTIAMLDVKMYMLAESPWARKMDAGINTHVSIGFKAPRAQEVTDEDGKLLWREYRFQGNTKIKTEALEGSLVFLGSQYGAGSTKSPDEGDSEMIKLKLFGKEFELDSENPDSMKAVTEAADQELAKVADAQGKIEAAVNELKEIKVALGGEQVTKEKAAEIAKQAQEYYDGLVEETLKYGQLCGLIETSAVEERRAALKAQTIAQIKVSLGDYQKLFKEKNPQYGTLPDNKGEGAQKQVKEIPGGHAW